MYVEEFQGLREQWKSNRLLIDQLLARCAELQQLLVPQDQLQLKLENRQIMQLLKQYEQSMDIIMGKFRNQTLLMNTIRRELHEQHKRDLESQVRENDNLRKENEMLKVELQRLVALIRESLNDQPEDELISQLVVENANLKLLVNKVAE
jgi:hypothetical protein